MERTNRSANALQLGARTGHRTDFTPSRSRSPLKSSVYLVSWPARQSRDRQRVPGRGLKASWSLGYSDHTASVPTQTSGHRTPEKRTWNVILLGNWASIGKRLYRGACHSLNNGAPGRIRTSDRLVRRHASQFVYLHDNINESGFLIPNKFPLDRPRWADLAMSGRHLLGTVLHPRGGPICCCMAPFIWTADTVVSLSHLSDHYRKMPRVRVSCRLIPLPIDMWLRIRHAQPARASAGELTRTITSHSYHMAIGHLLFRS